MNHEQAKVVVDLMLKHGSDLNALLVQLESMGTGRAELDQIKRRVGDLMGSMLLDIMNPIFDLHPDLKPKELD